MILPGSRIRANGIFGTITDNPLTAGAIVFNSDELQDLTTIVGDHAIVTFDPLRQFGDPEMAMVTAHSVSATVATVQRGMFGSPARQHPQGTLWAHAATNDDFTRVVTSGTRPPDPYESQIIYESDTTSYQVFNGSVWVDFGALAGGFPVAMIVPTGATTAPSGWLMCEGGEALGSTYPALATELGTGASSRFGAATTGFIKLPDLRQRIPMGKAASGTGSILASVGGSKDAVTVSHNHPQDSHNHTQNSHNHTQNSHGHGADDNNAGIHEHDTPAQYVITHDSGGAFNFNVVNSSSPYKNQEVTFTDPTSPAGEHNHNITVVDATATNQGFTATNQGFTATNQATGVSGTDANLQPWLSVNYMIKAH